jgi:hypothetical protein
MVNDTPWPLYAWESDPTGLVQKVGRAWGLVWKVTLLNTSKTCFLCVLWMSNTSLFIYEYGFCTKNHFWESWQTRISFNFVWLPQIVGVPIGTTIFYDLAKNSQCHLCGYWLAQPDDQSSKCFQGRNLQLCNKTKHFNIKLLHPCTYEWVLTQFYTFSPHNAYNSCINWRLFLSYNLHVTYLKLLIALYII